MPIHGSLFQDYQETTGQDPFVLQNKKLLKINMGYGPVNARLGSMVAYQGDVRFEKPGSGGLNKMLKKAVTGEGVDIMQATGSGELFVADMASEVQVFYLENDMVSCNGASVWPFPGQSSGTFNELAAALAWWLAACTTSHFEAPAM